MQIGMLVDEYPKETFVIRQAEALSAKVYCGAINAAMRETVDSESYTNVGGVSGFKHGMARKLANRFFRLSKHNVFLALNNLQEQALSESLLADKCSVLVAQFAPNGMRAQRVCSKLDIPLVVHCHGYDVTSLLRFPDYVQRLRLLFDQAQAFVAVSTRMRDSLAAMGCPEEKIHVIPCGVPLAEFPMVERSARKGCEFIFVGRFVEKKSPLSLIKAFSHCVDGCDDVSLTMVGAGDLLGDAHKLVESLGLEDVIRCVGEKSSGEIQRYFSQADCYVQHSVTASCGDQEGWPVSIAEAAASGLPVVATDHAGIVDQVVEGKSGYLVKEHDIVAMGARMMKVAKDPDWRLQAGKIGRRHMEENGSFERSAEKLRTVCQAVI